MSSIVSLVFRVLCFSHKGKIVTINEMSLIFFDSATNLGSTVSLIENSNMRTESIGVGMYPSLMGTFNFSTPVSYIFTTLFSYSKSIPLVPITRVGSFRTTYFKDPWVLLSPCESVKGRVHVGMTMPLFAVEITY
jgi:hypothetical protein